VRIRPKYSATVAFSWQEDKDGTNKQTTTNSNSKSILLRTELANIEVIWILALSYMELYGFWLGIITTKLNRFWFWIKYGHWRHNWAKSLRFFRLSRQGRLQKNFQGEGRQQKKRPKNSTIKPLPGRGGRGNGKKDRKIAKNDRKIALLSLYLLYLCHVWKSSRKICSPLPTPLSLGIGKQFSSEIFALCSEKNFCIFYNRISTNHTYSTLFSTLLQVVLPSVSSLSKF